MNDLPEFLLARIAEDEAVARAAVSEYCDTNWRVEDGLGVVDQYDSVLVYREGDEQFPAHIARWSPARVLAECEAKRRIVVRCQEMQTAAVPMAVHLAQQTLVDLGRAYADHPEYRDEWRP